MSDGDSAKEVPSSAPAPAAPGVASKENGEVSAWLRGLGFSEYVSAFAENGINPVALPRLTDSDLKELGVTLLGHRKVMLHEISKLGGKTLKISPAAAAKAVESANVESKEPLTASGKIAAANLVAGDPRFPNVKRPPASVASLPPVPAPKISLWKKMDAKFLLISIGAHVLLGLVAAYLVVQTITSHKLTFVGSPPSPNPSQRSLEHEVKMAKRKNTMSAPVPVKRVVSTGVAKISLPDMPAMPVVNANMPSMSMTGMAGAGPGFGAITGMGEGSGGGGGGIFSVFGVRDSRVNGLVGQFYDLKRTKFRQDSKMTSDLYGAELGRFVRGGWNEALLEKYLKSPHKLYTTQIFFPRIDSHEGPKDFGSEFPEPGYWVVLYKGQVSPPDSGTYNFVAAGDDVMVVKFNGRVVLDNAMYGNSSVKAPDVYKYPNFTYPNVGFAKSLPFSVTKGEYYDIEVLIGDMIPPDVWAFLTIEKSGENYGKDAGGAPILPVFRLSPDKTHASPAGDKSSPPYVPDGPVWTGHPANPASSLMPPVSDASSPGGNS